MHRKRVYRRLFDFTSILCLKYFRNDFLFSVYLLSSAGFFYSRTCCRNVCAFLLVFSLLLSIEIIAGKTSKVGYIVISNRVPCIDVRLLFVLIELDAAAAAAVAEAVVQRLPRLFVFIVFKNIRMEMQREPKKKIKLNGLVAQRIERRIFGGTTLAMRILCVHFHGTKVSLPFHVSVFIHAEKHTRSEFFSDDGKPKSSS